MGIPVSFADARKDAEKAGLISSGDYLKIKEGANRLRLLSICLPHKSVFNGNAQFKWLCYVIDRRDGKAKPFFMPHTVYKQIEALQGNPDYEFTEVPMPYDVTIQAVGAGTKNAKYTVLPARSNSPITAVEAQQIADLQPLADLQKKLLEKEEKQGGPVHDEADPNPFDE